MPATESLNITLPRDMAEMVRGRVRSGDYASDSDVIRKALQLLQHQETLRADKLAWLRREIEIGRRSGDAASADDVFDRLDAKYAAMADERETS